MELRKNAKDSGEVNLQLPYEVISYKEIQILTKHVKKYQVIEGTSHCEEVNAGNKQPENFQ